MPVLVYFGQLSLNHPTILRRETKFRATFVSNVSLSTSPVELHYFKKSEIPGHFFVELHRVNWETFTTMPKREAKFSATFLSKVSLSTWMDQFDCVGLTGSTSLGDHSKKGSEIQSHFFVKCLLFNTWRT